MANIIISYRRSDSAAIAGRVRDGLAQYYGADAIFIDIDNIPFGIDYQRRIQEAVAKNDILLALIGPKIRVTAIAPNPLQPLGGAFGPGR
jgi:hypothetical protein